MNAYVPDDLVWPEVDEEILKLLPPVLRAFVKALGVNRAQTVLRRYGGQQVDVPYRSRRIFGLDENGSRCLLVALEPHMGADRRIYAPKPDKLFILVRNNMIRRERYSKSVPRLAKEYDLSNRQIENICRPDLDEQLDMFG